MREIIPIFREDKLAERIKVTIDGKEVEFSKVNIHFDGETPIYKQVRKKRGKRQNDEVENE